MLNFFVYCGEDIVSSRNLFQAHIDKFKSQGFEVIRIPGTELKEDEIENTFGAKSLFGERRILAVENLLSSSKAKDKENLLEKMLSFTEESFLFWEEKDFSKKDQQKYPQFQFINCKKPESVFRFLELLRPGEISQNIRNFQQAISSGDISYVFLMLVRQIRLLILAKDNNLEGMAPWQRAKIHKQALFFDMEKLENIYRKLLEIDYLQKTSSLALNLTDMVELLILKI